MLVSVRKLTACIYICTYTVCTCCILFIHSIYREFTIYLFNGKLEEARALITRGINPCRLHLVRCALHLHVTCSHPKTTPAHTFAAGIVKGEGRKDWARSLKGNPSDLELGWATHVSLGSFLRQCKVKVNPSVHPF